ncbi:MAG: hypothetical protein KAT56_09730 [Sedimentisphaerales bacterium]|nr:hypothetical protein [Sedimentisphaerales bacterium]
MMKKSLILLLILPFLTGCGTTIRRNIPTSGVSLHKYSKLHLMLATAAGAISVNNADLSTATGNASFHPGVATASGFGSSVGTSHAMSGSSQALLVAQDLSFELSSIGFQMVDSKEDADAVVLFSIGTVRFDPLVGWIADQAFLVFKNPKSGMSLCSFKANTQFITPTVTTIVKSLVREVRHHY